jgi:hypothetical protein
VVAITGVLIVVTLMTNTTDKFIDLLNESIFKAFGWETRIEKVPTKVEETPKIEKDMSKTAPAETASEQLESNVLPPSETAPLDSAETEPTTEEANTLSALRARRARMAAENADTPKTSPVESVVPE